MRLRRYAPALVIGVLLAVSGFTAAAIASSSGVASLLQTATATTTVLATTTVVNTTTVSETTTVAPRKVTMCHHTHGKKGTKHVTIRVNQSAVRAHQRHGDTIGACTTTRNKKVHRAKAHARKFHKKPKRR